MFAMQKYLLAVLALLIHIELFSQQDNTLFLMHNIPQSNLINPAVQINCQQYIGLPTLSSFHLNFNSTGFSYSSFANGTTALDLNGLMGQMHSWDFLSEELHYTPISFGFMYDRKQYFNFAWTERVETKVFIPKKFLSLFVDGNTQFLGNGLKTRNPGVNAMYYREFSFGYSKQLKNDLIVGVHAKLLFGLGGIFTRRKPINVEVDALTHDLYGSWNPKVDVAYPVSVETDAQGNVTGVNPDGFSPMSFFLNFGNQGLAADFGFIWKKDDITWSGSILDLGLIWWHKNTTRFENQGEFAYRGATPADLADPNAYIDELNDSINNQIQFTHQKKGFFTLLNPKIYFGGNYPIHERLLVGGHIRTEWYPGRPVLGFTLSGTAYSKKGSSVSVTYSAMNGSFMNLGLGFGWGTEKFQFYMMSDNLMVAFFPEKARNANLRFGFNMFFGCTDKKKEVKVPRTDGCGCYWRWDDKTRRRKSGVK